MSAPYVCKTCGAPLSDDEERLRHFTRCTMSAVEPATVWVVMQETRSDPPVLLHAFIDPHDAETYRTEIVRELDLDGYIVRDATDDNLFEWTVAVTVLSIPLQLPSGPSTVPVEESR